MKLEELTTCGACGELTALSDKVACRLCRLAREIEREQKALDKATAKVTAIQDTLRLLMFEEATYRGQVMNASTLGGTNGQL